MIRNSDALVNFLFNINEFLHIESDFIWKMLVSIATNSYKCLNINVSADSDKIVI